MPYVRASRDQVSSLRSSIVEEESKVQISSSNQLLSLNLDEVEDQIQENVSEEQI